MIEILAGIGCGMAVCAFGMWCFIRGTQFRVQMDSGEIPENLKNPVQTAAHAVGTVINEVDDAAQSHDAAKKNLSLQEQVLNMQRG